MDEEGEKISGLTELTEIASDDLLTVVDVSDNSMAESGTNKKVILANLGFPNGWIPAGETWTYASATTFTISGDKTDKYQRLDKIKFTQTTDKYFYIDDVSESDGTTTVTVIENEDYTIVDAIITSPFYSKVENPQGFPDWRSNSYAFASIDANLSITSSIQTIPFKVSILDPGDNLDTSAGTFVAPITGLYNVSYGFKTDSWTTGDFVYIAVRFGSVNIPLYTMEVPRTKFYFTGSFTHTANSGDAIYLTIQNITASRGRIERQADRYTQFMVSLISI